MKVPKEMLDELTKKLADEGRLIEAGWVSLRIIVIPEDASDSQIADMRAAFFSGAQHLFSSIMNMLEPGQEATEKDLKRLTLISEELDTFVSEMKGTK